MLRAPSQIPVRSKFLIAVDASVRGNGAVADASVISLTDGFETIMTAAEVNANFAATDFSQGALFRDLGRQVMVVNGSTHLALYREAMPQASAANEGINYSNPPVWLRVWAADGSAVRVARLG